jgi:DNA-directed RNA polymerase II subunit RPB2
MYKRERDVIIAHGMAQFLKEVLLDKSDIYATFICDLCGLIAQKMLDKDVWHCPSCSSPTDQIGKNSTRISKVVIPYACKLLFQELMAMQIAPRILTSESKNYSHW